MKQKISPLQRVLNVWAIILIAWSIYRANFRMPEWFDEFIAKPLIFVLPVYIYIKKVENKNFFSAISLKTKLLISDLIFGVLIALIFISSAILANFIKLHKFVLFTKTSLTIQDAVFVLVIALATSISEEILSRGFVLKRLYEESKNIFTSSFFASILFFFLHVPILFTNIKITGNLLLVFMAVDIVLSLFNSLVFLTKKDLVLPILIHAFYNMTIILFI